MTNHQENTKLNHNEISSHTSYDGYRFQELKNITNVGKDAERKHYYPRLVGM